MKGLLNSLSVWVYELAWLNPKWRASSGYLCWINSLDFELCSISEFGEETNFGSDPILGLSSYIYLLSDFGVCDLFFWVSSEWTSSSITYS